MARTTISDLETACGYLNHVSGETHNVMPVGGGFWELSYKDPDGNKVVVTTKKAADMLDFMEAYRRGLGRGIDRAGAVNLLNATPQNLLDLTISTYHDHAAANYDDEPATVAEQVGLEIMLADLMERVDDMGAGLNFGLLVIGAEGIVEDRQDPDGFDKDAKNEGATDTA